MFVFSVPKISQVMMKWRRRASHRGRLTLWFNGPRPTTQLGRLPLCGTTAAELHNSVNLLCGTTAAELNHTFSKDNSKETLEICTRYKDK